MAYTVTISHHSIARAAVLKAETLDEAKQLGDRKFGDGFADHVIVVRDGDNGEVVATRIIGGGEWNERIE